MYKYAEPLSYPTKEKDSALLQNLLKYGLGAGAVGFGAGSLASLVKHLRRPDLNTDFNDVNFPDITVPLPVKKKRPLYAENYKVANILNKVTDKIRSGLEGITGTPSQATSGSVGSRLGTLLRDHSWVLPTAAVGLPAAAYLGYSGARSLGDNFKQVQDDDDLEEAKREYEAALMGKESQVKKASPLGDALGNATGFGSLILNALASPGGAYAAMAVPAAAAGAYYGYTKNKDQNRKAIATALKRRAQLRAFESPPPIHVMPRKMEEDEDPEKT